MQKVILALVLLSQGTGCTDNDAGIEPEDSTVCEDGKCDGPSSSPPNSCSVQAPPAGTYALTNASPAMKQLFERWLAAAAPVDSYVKNYKYFNGQKLQLEKVIQQDGSRVVFQAAISWPATSCETPYVASFVVFYDGTSFRWYQGRHELAVGTSHLVNVSAAATDACHYGSAFDPSTFQLVAANGQNAKYYFPSEVVFRRVSDDVVLASGRDASTWQPGHTLGLSQPFVTTVIRPNGFYSFGALPVPCTGTLF